MKCSYSSKICDKFSAKITVGHWPLSYQFQRLAKQNPFWSATFPIYFQWNSNQ